MAFAAVSLVIRAVTMVTDLDPAECRVALPVTRVALVTAAVTECAGPADRDRGAADREHLAADEQLPLARCRRPGGPPPPLPGPGRRTTAAGDGGWMRRVGARLAR